MKALIYTRVSQDKAGGRSVEEQEKECRRVCEDAGWSVYRVLCDNDVGASRYSKGKRTAWQEVRTQIERGNVAALVTWEASRAQRDLGAYSALRDLCAKYDVKWNYSGTTYDLSKRDDRFRTGLDALLAEDEAARTSERVCRAMTANADNGTPHGRIPYGYARKYRVNAKGQRELEAQVPDPIEAPIVRRIFDQYLAGIGQRRIANALNADGLTRRGGAAWSDIQVKRVLVNPTYVGKRVHRGTVVGDGDWDELVSAETFERAQERVRAMTERKSNVTGRASLLAGLARCGKCNGRMTVQTDRKSESGRRYYICRERHCVSRDKAKLDAYLTAVVLERLALPDVREALGDSEPDPAVVEARAEVEHLRSERDAAMSLWQRGELSVTDYSKMTAVLDQRIATIEASMPRLAPLTFDLPAVDTVPAWWAGLDHGQHREVVAALVSAVVVRPTGRGTRDLDPAAIEVHWR